jgi:FixJ family two-component response regulator
MAHVVAGRHNREIALLMNISARTVEVYKARLMDKLDIHRVPDLVRFVLTIDGTALLSPPGQG